MPKSVKISLIIIVSIVMLSVAFGAGCIVNFGQSQSTGLNTSLISQAWNIITRNYVEPENIDTTVLNQGAINGIVQSLNDPYSYYLNPDDYKLAQGNFQSSFGGIGATISANEDGQPIIVDTMTNSPSDKAGIMVGDIILAVNEKSTDGLTTTQVVSLVRGEVGTPVTLLIFREGQTIPVEIEVVRGEINPNTVEYRMEQDIAYIQISNFYERTNIELEAALQALDLANAKGIILDLRNNLGGYVNILVEVAGHFIKDGVVIIQQDNQGQRTPISVKPNGTFTELPIVVLVNQYSASASELLSGALQDYKRATIAGTITFGKGSYDAFYTLSDGSAIYLTIGRVLTPNGRIIEGTGITPDITLTETGEEAIQWAINYLHNPD